MIDDLGKYYEWADKRVIALLEALDDELFGKVLKGIDRSIRDLAEHLIFYYEYYLHRKNKLSSKTLKVKLKGMDKNALLKHWKQALKEFSETVENFGEELINIPISKGKTAKIPGDVYLFAFTDHATYHRGQLITIYKVITGKKAIATDYYDFLIDGIKNK
jgi:uncharacterized damage-inducible protein DinB